MTIVFGTAACSLPANDSHVESSPLLNTEIVGGENTPLESDVAAATIELQSPTGVCSAVLIASDLALSAAHCYLDNQPHRLDFPLAAGGPAQRTVDGKELPPEFNLNRLNSLPREKDLADLVILHFSGGLPAGYRPASMLSTVSALDNSSTLLLAGFGVTDPNQVSSSGVLHEVQVSMLDRDYAFSEIQVDASHGGSCYGDSGGPAFARLQGTLYLVGVDNWGEGACNQFSIYALVSAHSTWLQSATLRLRSAFH